MEILRFTLKGQHAFYKKPEVNSYFYFTYGNIHKVALLGMFGAILGYGGYTQMKGYGKEKKSGELFESYPEFYDKLKAVKVSILPSNKYKNGVIPKKIQSFNNSVGYASKELGGNLIVKEQWLESPEWEICVLLDCEEALKLKESIINHRCIFYPYLGKNDHPADLLNIRVEKAEKIAFDEGRLDCLAPETKVELADLDYEDKEELNAFGTFQYKEALPMGMDGWTNQYILEKMIYTDEFLNAEQEPVYQLSDQKKIIFY